MQLLAKLDGGVASVARSIWSAWILANSYLDIAESVLRSNRTPMSPKQILAEAYLAGLVPGHLFGETQEKTLQARLSEDIFRLRDQSLFFRTNRATFFLREFQNDDGISLELKSEYYAIPRRKSLRKERILAIRNTSLEEVDALFFSKPQLDSILESGRYRYAVWSELKRSQRAEVPVFSFSIFHQGSYILSHSVGRYKERSHPHAGARTIGFGAAVRAIDTDLLYDSYFGIIGSSINELAYSLGAQRELIRKARYGHEIVVHCAIGGVDKIIGPYIRVIMSYECPNYFSVNKESLSLNGLEWISGTDITRSDELDDTSNRLVSSGALTRLLAIT